MTRTNDSTAAALEAYQRGYTPIPIRSRTKRPWRTDWTHTRWTDIEQVEATFAEAREDGAENIGLVLGAGGLVDVDLDHPLALRLRDYFIPPTPMETGRPGSPRSHRWFLVDGDIPSTRQYKLPDKSMIIELRSTGGQTLIPPSVWSDSERPEYTEPYQWEGEPWGGLEGPTIMPARVLSIQVALLALTAVLVERWPGKGSRHEAYVNLAGGLLRHGEGVHEYWEDNVHVLIEAIAEVTNDEDGPDNRINESVGSTLRRIRRGQKVAGFPKLAELIGEEHAEMARRMAREVESLAGFSPEVIRDLPTPNITVTGAALDGADDDDGDVSDTPAIPMSERNPLEERISSWAAVDLEPYLAGEVVLPEPSVLRREDGQALFYPGRVNSLYGKSESAKSWIAMYACIQEMWLGERVVYLDFEDEPAGTIARMRLLGAPDDDIKHQFRYVHPEGPLASMQRYNGRPQPSEDGLRSESVFKGLLESFDPTLIVADGLTAIYGLHGLDTNHATSTDVITSWFKTLTRRGRTTVIVIDHTGKTGGKGSAPIGAHHKIAMIQGTALRVDAVIRPMQGERGHVRLAVHKDRMGAVRAVSSREDEQVAAEVYIDSTQPDMVRMEIKPPMSSPPVKVQVTADAVRRQQEKDTILGLFDPTDTDGMRTSDIATMSGVDAARTRLLLRDLVDEGKLRKEGQTKGTRYHLIPVAVVSPDPVTGEVPWDDDDERDDDDEGEDQ